MDTFTQAAVTLAALVLILVYRIRAQRQQDERDATQREIRDRLRSLDDKTTKHDG